MDSGLGEDLAAVPGSSQLRQMVFSAGLKRVAPENADKVKPLILETLKALARDGLEPEMVEAAVNTIEFALRENSAYGGQRGIVLFQRALSAWLHGGDPFVPLAFETTLAQLKDNLAADPRYFSRMIHACFLDNPHRLTLLLEPDPQMPQRREAEEQARLAEARAAMTAAERQAVVENTRTLRQLQAAPNTPEALATLPMLKRSDLDRENKRIPLEVGTEAGSRVLYHALPTSGIVYLDLGMDLRALPQEDLPYAAVLGRVLLEMGTAREDFVRLSQHIDRTTGGIAPVVFASESRTVAEGPVWLFLRGKAMADKGSELLSILRDVLLTVRLDNHERFRQIVLQEKARREASLIPRGAGIVNARLGAHFGQAGWASDQIGSLGGLFALRQLAQDMERDWPGVLARLEAIRAVLVNRTTMLANVTADPALWADFRPALAAFLGGMPASAASPAHWSPPALPPGEGFAVPAQVNYVGKGANLYALGYTLDGSVLVVTRYLSTTWLYDRIRAQGGAYGGSAGFDYRSGMFSYLSYRDPNLLSTLDNYDGSPDFLRQLDLTEDELTKSIIGAIGDLDTYMLPSTKGFVSLARYLTGDSDEQRQQLRDEILATTVEHFRRFAETLDAVRQEGHVVILAPEDSLRAANKQHGGQWLALTRAL
jgi:Zn-dependent M16 (insulinase) family peptidase